MNIIITGASGFIGNYIYNNLVNHYDVIGIDISPGMKKCYYCIDLVNSDQIVKFFHSNKNIDVIIHSAALAHNKGSDLSFDKFKRVNYDATKNLVDLSNKYLNLKKFIFFSSISVYGEEIEKQIYYETDKLNPKTPYAITKRMSEDYIITNAKFNYTILRFAPVYSEEFTLNIDRRTIIRNKIYRIGNGNNKFSILNIKNILSVIKFLLKNLELFNNEIFNLADKRLYSFNDLITYQLKKLKSIRVIKIPKFAIYLVYLFGNVIKNYFLIENSIKLISNNIYDTSKISSRIVLPYDLNDSL